MHFSISKYENYLDRIHLSTVDVERQLIASPFIEATEKNEDIEKAEIGSMVIPFYNYILHKGKIPNQETFYKEYQTYNLREYQWVIHCVGWGLEPYERNLCLYGRVCGRSYPSFVRDIYFALLCKERCKDYSVLYNPKLDMEVGVDILFSKGDSHVGACLYQNSTRGEAEYNRKKEKQKAYENLRYLKCPLPFSKDIGNFHLFADEEYESVMHEVRNLLP